MLRVLTLEGEVVSALEKFESAFVLTILVEQAALYSKSAACAHGSRSQGTSAACGRSSFTHLEKERGSCKRVGWNTTRTTATTPLRTGWPDPGY